MMTVVMCSSCTSCHRSMTSAFGVSRPVTSQSTAAWPFQLPSLCTRLVMWKWSDQLRDPPESYLIHLESKHFAALVTDQGFKVRINVVSLFHQTTPKWHVFGRHHFGMLVGQHSKDKQMKNHPLCRIPSLAVQGTVMTLHSGSKHLPIWSWRQGESMDMHGQLKKSSCVWSWESI